MFRHKPVKAISRALRLSLYHWLNGPGFRYHGIPISIPDEIPFAIKKQLMRGGYEEPERRLVDRFLDPAMPVIELGGSLGVLSAFISSKLLPQTPYVIVEANPKLVETCRQNAERGRGSHRRPIVVHCAIAYGVPEVSFPVTDNVHGNRVGGGAPDLHDVSVTARTLADIYETIAPQSGDFSLVMDIEGSEFDVFLNDPDVLANCKLAIVETHPQVFLQRGKTLADFLDLARAAKMEILAQDRDTFAFGRS